MRHLTAAPPSLLRAVAAVVALLALVAAPPAAHAEDTLHGKGITIERIRPHVFEVTFSLAAAASIKSVHLAGSFNDWKQRDHPLALDAAAGVWSGRLELTAGEYRYKFVVNGTEWRADALNPLGEPDDFGGRNSILRLGAMARVTESRAAVGDGKLGTDTLIHIETLPLYFRPQAGGNVIVRVITLSHDAEKVELLRPTSANDPSAQVAAASMTWGTYPMSKVLSNSRFDYWETSVLPDTGNVLLYAFLVTDGTAICVVDAGGARPGVRKPDQPFLRRFDIDRVFRVPSWARDTVWYEIVPDRWRNGFAKNDARQTRPWTSAWKQPSPWEGKDGQSFYTNYVFDRTYGGDFQGVVAQLNYLQRLGVTGLYFTPVFVARGYSRYDTVDYRHIDDRLAVPGEWDKVRANEDLLDATTWKVNASDQLFLHMLSECKKRGIRVIVDAVFNHSGNEHLAFVDARERKQESPYQNWYNVTSWDPFEYEGWGGFGMLPTFKEDAYGFVDSRLRQHLFDVTRRWMDPNGDGDPSDGVDGWRLDAAPEVSEAFWVEWRQHVKSINPEALIVGEVWDRAEEYLAGDQFDSVMNYRLAALMADYFINRKKKMRPSELENALADMRLAVAPEATLAMMNLIDSHDTDRVLSMFFNPDRPYDRRNRLQGDGPTYNDSRPDQAAREGLKFLLAFKFTYPGAPMIYYGDEVGMFGPDDPGNRQPMWWDDLAPYEDGAAVAIDQDLAEYYKRVIAIRNTWACFRSGTYTTLLADDKNDIFAFARQGTTEAGVVVLNRSDAERLVVLDVRELKDPHGPVRQWTGVLRERDYTIYNFRPENAQYMLRGIRINSAVQHKTTPSGTLEVKMGPRQAAILVAGLGK